MINELPETKSILDQPAEIIDPLYLDLPEDKVIEALKSNIRASVSYYSDKHLYARQKKNVRYYLGDQKKYKASGKAGDYMENIIYEGISRQKPIELGRLPDLTVKAGSDSPESKKTAEMLSKAINNDIKKRENRKLLGLAIKQEPLYFYSVIKARWNPEKGLFGEYEFLNVHPDNVVWDHLNPDSDANNMRFVAEKTELTLKEVIMMFPDKEAEIKDEFGWISDKRGDEERMASPVNIWEVWFHWYELKGNETEEPIL
jgi:hypothetical protein